MASAKDVALATVLLGELAAGCGGTGFGTHRLTGPGGVAYQWPPPPSVAAGPATAARFCALVIDDYEHLKAVQGGTHPEPLPAATSEYAQMLPGLEARPRLPSPPRPPRTCPVCRGCCPYSRRTTTTTSPFRRVSSKTASDSKLASASTAVASYVNGQCHYDLSANLPIRPPTTS